MPSAGTDERRILLAGPLPPPYHGVAVYTEMVLRHGLGEGVRLIGLDTMNHRGIPAIEKLTPANVSFAIGCLFRLLRTIRRENPDWVHIPISQGFRGFLRDGLMILLARIAGRPVSLHLHGSAFGEFYKSSCFLTRWFIRFCLRRSAGAVVLGEILRGVFEGLLPPDKVRVATNGVDGAPSAAEVEAAMERRLKSPVCRIVCLGGISRGKGIHVLLDAAGIAGRRRNDIEFRIAGGIMYENERTEIEDLARRQGLGERLAFEGVISGRAKFEWLMDADLFVFPAVQREGLPLAILEAFSCGVPVLATPQGAIPEVLERGVFGELVPAGDAEAMAEAILRLAADRKKLIAMGRKARETFERRHTVSACCRELREAIFSLAGWRDGAKR